MPPLPLHQGAYLARNVQANAQSCINLYPEQNPPDAPFPVTHYPAPGLSVLSDYTGTFSGPVRGLYQASDGSIYVCFATTVIRWLGPGNNPVVLGNLVGDTGATVSMVDNGTTLVIVDGSNVGYMVGLANTGTPNSLQQIDDPAFYGADRVDFIDTFMVFNQPGTSNFYTTTSNVVTPFDPTYFAGKEGWNDLLVTIACLHDNIWLFGAATTEIWFNAGGSAFPFARMPNSVLQQGTTCAQVVITDNAVYWISQDRWGRNMCMRGEGYAAKRISTFAVEDEWSKYTTLSDAQLMSYQIGGHETIGIYFPSGGAWWAYDASTQLWHKRTYADTVTPWLPYCMCGWGNTQPVAGQVYNSVLAGDRTGPRILLLSRNNYTDAGVPIQRQRSWMHVQNQGNRAVHARFWANFNGYALSPDTLTLSWSDNGGNTYGAGVNQSCANDPNGNYQWRRLGYARDRVYQLNWSGQGEFALNGAWIDVIPQMT